MKFIYSFLLLLIFLCCRAQEQDTVSIDEIKDVVLLGIQKVDCQKIYNEEKALYHKQLKELKKVNFETLFEEVLKLKDLEKINFDERRILILNLDYTAINSVCGNDSYFKCQHYEKHIQNEVFENVWKKSNYLKIQKFFENKVIIPLTGLPFLSFEQNMNDENNYLNKYQIKPFFKGVYWDLNKAKKEFYYSSYQKPVEKLEIYLEKDKMIAENFLQLDMKIYPVVHENPNVYSVTVILKNEREELNRIDNEYQFKDGKFKLLKLK